MTWSPVLFMTAALIAAPSVDLSAPTPPVFEQTARPASARSWLNDCVNPDHGTPAIESLSFSTATVDTGPEVTHVLVRANVPDTGGPGPASGTSNVKVKLGNDDRRAVVVRLRPRASTTWVGHLDLTRWSPDGTWRVMWVFVRDQAGNHRQYGQPALRRLGLSPTLRVTSTPDLSPPKLTGFSFTPSHVNTTRRPKQVTFTATVVDGESGVDAPIRLYAPGVLGYHPTLPPVRGKPGIYRGSATIPRFAGDRDIDVYAVEFADNQGNGEYINRGELADAGFAHTIKLTSRPDRGPPRLTRFTFNPRSVDMRDSDATIGFSATIANTDAGTSSVSVRVVGPHVYRSLSMDLTSGTSVIGVWTGQLQLDRCNVHSGSWRVSISMQDRGHYVVNRTRELDDHGWRSRLNVLAGDHTPPWLRVADPGTGAAAVGIVANEVVRGLSIASLPLRPYNIRTHHFTGTAIGGEWACQNGAGETTDCLTASVRAAQFTPTTPLDPAGNYALVPNPPHVLALTDRAGNPMPTATIVLTQQ